MTAVNADKSKDRDKTPVPSRNFIQEIIDDGEKTSKFAGRVHTRFPAEPNAYLHIGLAASKAARKAPIATAPLRRISIS